MPAACCFAVTHAPCRPNAPFTPGLISAVPGQPDQRSRGRRERLTDDIPSARPSPVPAAASTPGVRTSWGRAAAGAGPAWPHAGCACIIRPMAQCSIQAAWSRVAWSNSRLRRSAVSVWPATCSDGQLGPRYCGPLEPPSVAPEGGLTGAYRWSAIGAAPSQGGTSATGSARRSG